jgi:SPP1 family predicted phage head-tail adaptor
MRAGELKHRIDIQEPAAEVQDSAGQVISGFETVITLLASIEQLSARERFVEAQRLATATHRIVVRYTPALDLLNASWRVLFGERVFQILGHSNVKERNRDVELLCEEGPPE